MEINLKMPDLGTTESEIKIIRWLVGIGSRVEQGQSLLEVETDKAVMEVESITGGILKKILITAEQTTQAGQALAIIGDGAVAEGAFHEAVNLAAIWCLPVIFACENNLYGASTHTSKVMRAATIAERAASYGIRGKRVDGNDVLAVYEAAGRAGAECRSGQGPVLLELMTYRRTGHSRRDPGHYQPKDEREAWMARDPIELFAGRLKAHGIADDLTLAACRQRVVNEFNRVVAEAHKHPLPDPARDLVRDVYS